MKYLGSVISKDLWNKLKIDLKGNNFRKQFFRYTSVFIMTAMMCWNFVYIIIFRFTQVNYGLIFKLQLYF